MSPRMRMLTTLSSLMAAMTISALLLGWIDPSQTSRLGPPEREAIIARAQNAVADGLAVTTNYWQGIEIVDGPNLVQSDTLLAARRDGPEAHFFVGTDGRVDRNAYWMLQETVPGAARKIRICLDRSPQGAWSAAQRLGVQALVQALTEYVPKKSLLIQRHQPN